MTIKALYPEILPSLNLDFARVKALDPRITFARAGSATYFGTRTVKAEENLLLRSQEFDNAAWVKSTATVTANATTAPDGTTTADKLIPNNEISGRVHQAFTLSGSNVFSVFAKKAEWNWIMLAQGNLGFVWFNLDTGVVGTQSSGYVGTITPLENDWYRCSMVFTGAGSSQVMRIWATNADNTTSNGDGTSGIFLWQAQLEQRSSVTAPVLTTTQPITRYQPVLETALDNVARFDHSPTTAESLGFLVEEQRVNLFQRSEEIDNAYWSKFRASIQPNVIIAPDGTLTADKLVEDTTASNTHQVSRIETTTNTNPNTWSIFLKKAERSFATVTVREGTTFTRFTTATFNLGAGTVTTPTNAGGASGTATITPIGNDWYRCSITSTLGGSDLTSQFFVVTNNGTTQSYTGDGYSGVYIWGAQLEAGSQATSYIKTEASQVTRPADSASMTGANFSSWFNNAEGTVYISYGNAPSTAATKIGFSVNDGTASNTLQVGWNSSNVLNPNIVYGGTFSASYTLGVDLTKSKVALAFKTDDVNYGKNGTVGATDTSAPIPAVNRMDIGNRLSAFHLNTTVEKIAFYPQRLSNAQLQALTS